MNLPAHEVTDREFVYLKVVRLLQLL